MTRLTLDYPRFLRAQDPVWSSVVAELTLGRKQTHWMWFVFPQLRALGRSETALFFGLDDLDAARDYAAHPLLVERLVEACTLVRGHDGRSAVDIFGKVDAMKLRSSMTLFAATPQMASCAKGVLDGFFGGERCPLTLSHLATPEDMIAGR